MKKILFSLIALLGIVACEEANTDTLKQTLQLTADNCEIVADGTDVATFAVADSKGAAVTDATIYFADTNEALTGNTFKTRYAGEYKFYAKRNNEKSNTIIVVAVKAETPDNPDNPDNPGDEPGTPEDPTKKQVVLSVSPTTIYADGEQKALFTLTVDGKSTANFDVYNAADDSKLAGNEFSTTETGVYTFYAMYEGEKTNSVNVNARMKIVEEEKPITLTASTTTIKANGVDTAKFTVSQDGSDVTSQATIYVNNGKLNGNKFATTSAGTYIVYAEKGSMVSESITITAEEVTSTGKTIVFADGVTISSGWYDVNKKAAGNNGDINMCWAAAASNMIQWFQDRYKADGNTLPSTAIDGPGTKTYTNYGPYELALMEVFHSEWNNSHGSNVEHAIPWYFEGNLYDGKYETGRVDPYGAGGYWKSVWNSILPNIYRGYKSPLFPDQFPEMYTRCYSNYYIWGDGSGLEGNERLAEFSNLVVESFKHGMASLTVSLAANLSSNHHAVTLWGYEIDNATGLLTRVWITDSDDLTSEPKSQLLNEYNVSISSGKSHVMLAGSTRYGAVYIVSIHPFSGWNSAK